MAFIENLTADSLSITPHEFTRYMTGKAVPHDPMKVYTCDGLDLMNRNTSSLSDLHSRQERIMAEALKLEQDIKDFCEGFRGEMSALKRRTPLTIRPRRTKVNLDDESIDGEGSNLLPPPLQPQVCEYQLSHLLTPPETHVFGCLWHKELHPVINIANPDFMGNVVETIWSGHSI